MTNEQIPNPSLRGLIFLLKKAIICYNLSSNELFEEGTLKATIIIPIKNGLSHLQKTLKSIEAQDHSLIEEVRIIENGSDEIHHFPLYPFKIGLIKIEEANRSLARNTGAYKTLSPVIVFLDADVIIENDWLKKMLNSFDDETLAVQGLIFPQSSSQNLLQKIRKSRIFFNNEYSFLSLRKSNIKRVVLNSAAFAIKTDVFFKVGMFDEKLGRHEDLDFTQRLLKETGKIKGISSIRSDVFFNSNLWSYFLREFNCGYHIVRYHEKWSSPKLSDSVSTLIENLSKWIKSDKKPDSLSMCLSLLELTHLMGNFVGIFRKIFVPYPATFIIQDDNKAQLVFE